MLLTESRELDAPIDAVWAVLSDTDKYPEWNPFTPKVVGTVAEGERITLHVRLGLLPWKQILNVSTVSPRRELAWHVRGVPPKLLRGGRTQTLTDLGDGRTRYDTEESLDGWIAPLVAFLLADSIQAGLRAVAEALGPRAIAVGDS
jgi:hypothetical protein